MITVGRFAPSPTGPLHFGSLVAATASYLCARQSSDGKWLLRIEDLDSQRSHLHHTHSIINTLEQYGFEWDDEITYQSNRNLFYQQALDNLKDSIYPCSCTRKFLKSKLGSNNKFSYIYPGFCRESITVKDSSHSSIRIKTFSKEVCFSDEIQGEFCQNIFNDVGDFILQRADKSFAYQLAVVVDDHLQGVNQVVRGADLFDNTPRQVYLQNSLNFDTPQYSHIPVAINVKGKKLSKQNSAPEISKHHKRKELLEALTFLGQEPPKLDDFSTLDDFWSYAVQNWNQSKVPKSLTKNYIPISYD